MQKNKKLQKKLFLFSSLPKIRMNSHFHIFKATKECWTRFQLSCLSAALSRFNFSSLGFILPKGKWPVTLKSCLGGGLCGAISQLFLGSPPPHITVHRFKSWLHLDCSFLLTCTLEPARVTQVPGLLPLTWERRWPPGRDDLQPPGRDDPQPPARDDLQPPGRGLLGLHLLWAFEKWARRALSLSALQIKHK